MQNKICILKSEPAIAFAARELARYLRAMTGGTFRIVSGDGHPDSSFILGLTGQDPAADTIRIRPRGNGCFIGGSNPRSVLFAVYRYLKALGCRWLRPGGRGEIVPRHARPLPIGLRIDEKAAYPFRTICIEGACSERHVLDLIDWMAKNFMNGYFIQFEYGTAFWRYWYTHNENPYLTGRRFLPEDAVRITERIVAALRRRGMRFERVGHGWTCAALGIPGEGWGQAGVEAVPKARRNWLALLNGKRQFWGGTPLNSNLCYSNPAVKRAMVDRIVHYARRHPEVTELHFWLADGSNNNCECPKCRGTRVSDFYVDYLNAIDAELTRLGVKTRIIFLIYVDLLWPPVKNRIKNPERFILMFAPIFRRYDQSFADAAGKPAKLAPYAVNKLPMDRDVAKNLAALRDWRKVFEGPGFDFDYHLLWPSGFDFSEFNLARVLNRDIRALQAIGLDGFNSCQVQRQSFPTNLLMDVMAQTLWDKRRSFEDIVRDTFRDAFGRDWRRVAGFLAAMSKLGSPWFNPVFKDGADERRVRQGLANLAAMAAAMRRFGPVVARNKARTSGAVRWSWRYMELYLGLMELLLPAYEAYLKRSFLMRNRFAKAVDYLWRNENILHPVFDVYLMRHVITGRMHEAEQAGHDDGA